MSDELAWYPLQENKVLFKKKIVQNFYTEFLKNHMSA